MFEIHICERQRESCPVEVSPRTREPGIHPNGWAQLEEVRLALAAKYRRVFWLNTLVEHRYCLMVDVLPRLQSGIRSPRC